jgi:hypothetical protein
MLHSMFVRLADVENFHTVGRGFSNRFDYSFHLRVIGVEITDIET